MSLQTTTQYVTGLPYWMYTSVSTWWYGQPNDESSDQKIQTTVLTISHLAQDRAIQQARQMGNVALAERLERIRQQS